jgi:hypothetical protein
MIIGKPAPFVRTFIDAVDQAIRQDHPDSSLSAMPRAWLAFCVTATLVTHSICWARFERASSVVRVHRGGSWRGLASPPYSFEEFVPRRLTEETPHRREPG